MKENTNDILTLQQDNSEKLKVSVERVALERYAKIFFNWRTSTKKYKTISERVFALGSTDYDNFIEFLYNRKGILNVSEENLSKKYIK